MRAKAVRLYGANDLRLEEFDLPSIKRNEILAKVVSDSLCMSSFKASNQGSNHKRVPDDIDQNPIIIGHEFCGEIIEVGDEWKDNFFSGQKFAIQPALNDPNGPVGLLSAPGYSYPFIGGDAQYVIIPPEVMQNGCLLPFEGEAFYLGSLAEPISCVAGACHANYHTKQGSYDHEMGIVEDGALALLAGVGPMGLAAIDYIFHCDRKPKFMLVTDIDQERLNRAESIYSKERALAQGIEIKYINSAKVDSSYLKSISPENGYNDVFVFAPVASLIEQADEILALDGCLNFFAGPSDPTFSASMNFYDIHYSATHVVATSGGNTNDLKEALDLMSNEGVDPSALITHVGGLNAVPETTLNLPNVPGGKKLIYTHIDFPLTALDEFKNNDGELYKQLGMLIDQNNGLWSPKAEKYLLENAPKI